MTGDANEQAAHDLFEALARLDFNAYERLLAEAAVEGRPQLGERFVGRENILGMYRSTPAGYTLAWRTIRGAGEVWVAEGIIDYGGDAGMDHVVGVVQMRDGKMVNGNMYFAAPLKGPIPYHQPWSEPFEF